MGNKKGETRVVTKSPCVNSDGRRRIQNCAPTTKLQSWKEWSRYKPDTKWAYLERAIEIPGAGAREGAVSRTDNTMRRTQGPGEISEIEGLPTGEESPEPNPGIETRREKRI